jgi:hypothetical protein
MPFWLNYIMKTCQYDIKWDEIIMKISYSVNSKNFCSSKAVAVRKFAGLVNVQIATCQLYV